MQQFSGTSLQIFLFSLGANKKYTIKRTPETAPRLCTESAEQLLLSWACSLSPAVELDLRPVREREKTMQ